LRDRRQEREEDESVEAEIVSESRHLTAVK
jgi:hypothetical protein